MNDDVDEVRKADVHQLVFEDVRFQLDQFPKTSQNEEMSPMPISLPKTSDQKFSSAGKERGHTEEGREGTNVDDDGDAVGQGKVTAEFTLHHIEVLISVKKVWQVGYH